MIMKNIFYTDLDMSEMLSVTGEEEESMLENVEDVSVSIIFVILYLKPISFLLYYRNMCRVLLRRICEN